MTIWSESARRGECSRPCPGSRIIAQFCMLTPKTRITRAVLAPEMLSEAKKAGVDAILLTDHHRPPRDFISDSWRGLRDGVLFVPGSEAAGFLLYPARSIMNHMNDPTAALIEATRADGGLIFLSHIEERPSHSMAGLDGMEIYNRHADAKKRCGRPARDHVEADRPRRRSRSSRTT